MNEYAIVGLAVVGGIALAFPNIKAWWTVRNNSGTDDGPKYPSDKAPTAEVMAYLEAISDACPTAGCSSKWNLAIGGLSPMQAAVQHQQDSTNSQAPGNASAHTVKKGSAK